MPPPRPTPRKPTPEPPRYRQNPPRPPATEPEVVDPLWLLRAFLLVVLAALICGYGSLCFLLYQGQWQLILHPKRSTSVPAGIAGTAIELVHFGIDDTGQPQLTGWAIPADPKTAPGTKYSTTTLLYLPSGDGSLTDALPTLQQLHSLGVNLFAFDYRGYGQSAAVHPDQARMTQDVTSAFAYLTGSRAIPAAHIVPYGTGVGASLAVHLAATHSEIPAVITDTPGPDPLATVLADPRTKYLPVRLLLHDRFELAQPLSILKTPKLLIYQQTPPEAYRQAADPKRIVQIPPGAGSTLTNTFLSRFLDETIAPLTPSGETHP